MWDAQRRPMICKMQSFEAGTIPPDEQLVVFLAERDGPLPERQREHRRGAEGCRYNKEYPRGNCPWCRQTAGVIEIAMRARRSIVILEDDTAVAQEGITRQQVS